MKSKQILARAITLGLLLAVPLGSVQAAQNEGDILVVNKNETLEDKNITALALVNRGTIITDTLEVTDQIDNVENASLEAGSIAAAFLNNYGSVKADTLEVAQGFISNYVENSESSIEVNTLVIGAAADADGKYWDSIIGETLDDSVYGNAVLTVHEKLTFNASEDAPVHVLKNYDRLFFDGEDVVIEGRGKIINQGSYKCDGVEKVGVIAKNEAKEAIENLVVNAELVNQGELYVKNLSVLNGVDGIEQEDGPFAASAAFKVENLSVLSGGSFALRGGNDETGDGYEFTGVSVCEDAVLDAEGKNLLVGNLQNEGTIKADTLTVSTGYDNTESGLEVNKLLVTDSGEDCFSLNASIATLESVEISSSGRLSAVYARIGEFVNCGEAEFISLRVGNGADVEEGSSASFSTQNLWILNGGSFTLNSENTNLALLNVSGNATLNAADNSITVSESVDNRGSIAAENLTADTVDNSGSIAAENLTADTVINYDSGQLNVSCLAATSVSNLGDLNAASVEADRLYNTYGNIAAKSISAEVLNNTGNITAKSIVADTLANTDTGVIDAGSVESIALDNAGLLTAANAAANVFTNSGSVVVSDTLTLTGNALLSSNNAALTAGTIAAADELTINTSGEKSEQVTVQSLSAASLQVNVETLTAGQVVIKNYEGGSVSITGEGTSIEDGLNGNIQNGMEQLAATVDIGTEKELTAKAGAVLGEIHAFADAENNVVISEEYENQFNRSVSEMAGIALMTWRQENNDMNKRLGELRDSKGEHGVWVRMTRGESKYGAQNIKNQYNAYQLGYDEKLSVDKHWTVGAALTYTDAESSFSTGKGGNKHKGFVVYGSYLKDDGSFIDLIAKYARLEHEFDVHGGAGTGCFDTNGYSLSAEYGKRFTKNNGLWVEPQVELTYGKVGSANYLTSNGVNVRQDGMDSLVGRLGFALGKDLAKDKGNVYLRASYLYDFEGETDVQFSKNGIQRGFAQDLGGGWWEVGVGANINFSEAAHLYFDVEKTYGGDVATPWQWNVGMRWSF